MGPKLHESFLGRKFFEHDFPNLVHSLQLIHQDNEKLIDIKEAELQMKHKELALKDKELALKERELLLKEKELGL